MGQDLVCWAEQDFTGASAGASMGDMALEAVAVLERPAGGYVADGVPGQGWDCNSASHCAVFAISRRSL